MSDHGTHNRYSHGCRCDPCRAAHAAYTRARRAAALAEGTLSHGIDSTYAAGCRCAPCTDAHRVRYYTVEAPARGIKRYRAT